MFHPEGEEEHPTKFYMGSPTPYPSIYTILDRKGTLFVYLLLTSLELCIPFNTVKALYLKYELITKPEHFSQPSYSPP